MSNSSAIKARSFLTAGGLSITKITGRPRSLGNVGLALSGGGSRAASVALGSVRALHHFNLMRHVRAISSVSGGSWFSVPFTFLPASFEDEPFLGPYVEDPASLRAGEGEAATDLGSLSPGNFGVPLTKFGMSVAGMVEDAVEESRAGVPTDRLWTHEVGEQLLAHFGLAAFDAEGLPVHGFCADEASLASIRMANPGFERGFHLVRGGNDLPRPYLIVNGAMRARNSEGEEVLAPVQFTPHFSGVMGTGIGTIDGREVGGGGISSFAFGGHWTAGTRERPVVEQVSSLALSDIAGISSAAFADALGDHHINDISPTLPYFSPTWDAPGGAVPGVFADAGSVENTGVANLLAYEDIDAVIAIVASPAPIEIRKGEVIVERQIGALFGYREYDRRRGYVRYSEPGEGNPDYADNQVFASDAGQFEELRARMGARHEAGEAIVVDQELEVVRNDKFAVRGGRKVRVLWSFLSPARQWSEELDPRVRVALGPRFPNILTARTQLREIDISALSHFSAWMLGQAREALGHMFQL